MVKKDDRDLILLLGLLGLAFLGKGPLATPPAPKTMDTSMIPDSGGGRSTAPGENSMPTDMGGVTSRSGPGNDVQNFPGGSSGGVPDKSKGMPSSGMPSFMIPPGNQNVANLINPIAPGGMMIGPNTYFRPGLDLFGNPSGGPGPGPTTPSISTVYGGKTYTNFDPALLLNKNMGEQLQPDVIKQPAVPPSIMPPMMIPAPGQMFSFPNAQFGPIIPVEVPPPNMYTFSFDTGPITPPMKVLPPEMIIPPVFNIPTPKPPGPEMGSMFVQNPLPQQMNLLQMLAQSGMGFGQNVLNSLINAGQGLSQIFSNLPMLPNNLFGLPSPFAPPQPIAPEIAI